MASVDQKLLTSVRLALTHAQPSLDALVPEISAFLDCTELRTLEKAADRGLLKLMDRLAAREWPGVGANFRLARCKHGARRAASNGELEVLQWWMTSYLTYDGDLRDIYSDAVYYGHMSVVRWLHATHSQLLDEAIVTSVRYGKHPEIVCWLREQGCTFRFDIRMDWAANTGDLAFFRLLDQDRDAYVLKRLDYAFEAAAGCGNMEILQWLCEKYAEDCVLWVRGLRFGFADVAITRWLLETYPDIDLCHPGEELTKTDDFQTIQWAMEEFPWKSDCVRVEYNGRIIVRAAERGDIRSLEYLWSYRDPELDGFVIDRAAVYGQLRVIRWIHERSNTEIPSEAIHMAAENGHLGLVAFLHANGVEVSSPDAMDMATTNNHLDVVQWLHENLTVECTTNAMDDAAARGNLEMVQWLHKNRSEGCTPIAMNYAAPNGHLEIVEYLDANRSEGCTTRAMDRAAANGHLNVVKWLYTHRSEGCTSAALDSAAQNGHLEVVKFLVIHCNMEFDFTAFIDENQFAVKEWFSRRNASNIAEIKYSV